MLGWGWFVQYRSEEKQVKEAIENVIQNTADAVQRNNATLNNLAKALKDKDYKTNMGFAIGMTKNRGKMQLYGDDDTSLRTEAGVPDLDQKFLDSLNVKFIPKAVKTIDTFALLFKEKLNKEHLPVSYTIHKITASANSLPANSSEPFIINFFDPSVYYVAYTIPRLLILKKMLPYCCIAMLLLCLVSGAFIMYHRGYKIQLQMAQFKENLFSNVTHELKTPVTSLQLIISSLQNNTGNTGASKQQEYIDFASAELDRMQTLINKLLSFSKLSEQQFELSKEIVNADELIKEAIQIVQPQAEHYKTEIIFEPHSNIELLGDQTLLLNVIINLVENAMKHNTNKPIVRITLEKQKSKAVITVADNGVGIAPNYYNKIFKPFFRIQTGDVYTGGHGIGLSFASQAVKLHNGSITVTSILGQGSTFTISLPSL